ncbi:MAG: hypothetical protein ACYDGR_17945, partial [Candidatus Dormibacteria bacterium]
MNPAVLIGPDTGLEFVIEMLAILVLLGGLVYVVGGGTASAVRGRARLIGRPIVERERDLAQGL